MTAWVYVVAFTVIAWGSLTIGSVIKGGALSGPINWFTGVTALATALIAGEYARATWIYRLAGWVLGLHYVVRLFLLAVVIILCASTLLIVMVDRVSAMTATPAIVFAWLIVPSLLAHRAIPGTVGLSIANVVDSLGVWLVSQTAGAFG